MAAAVEETAINSFSLQKPCLDSHPPSTKRRRNLPGNPDPDAEVVALSPRSLLATNRFLCEICGKGFQREQNLQLHRRGHNLPWRLRQRSGAPEPRAKRVYVCPEASCVHHHPSRALGDLTGIKKHFCRKHGEKKWRCDRCSKRYAVQSDWKAHCKTCGTREYRCDCGTLFSRRDSFITHRAFCDALAEEIARVAAASNANGIADDPPKSKTAKSFPPIFKNSTAGTPLWMGQGPQCSITATSTTPMNPSTMLLESPFLFSSSNPQLPEGFQLSFGHGNKFPSSNSRELKSTDALITASIPSLYTEQHQHQHQAAAHAGQSATALLQKAAQMGATPAHSSLLGGSLGEECCRNRLLQANSICNEELLFDYLTAVNYGGDLDDAIQEVASANLPQLRRIGCKKDGDQEGQTRDFLGVGVQEMCPSSIRGWE